MSKGNDRFADADWASVKGGSITGDSWSPEAFTTEVDAEGKRVKFDNLPEGDDAFVIAEFIETITEVGDNNYNVHCIKVFKFGQKVYADKYKDSDMDAGVDMHIWGTKVIDETIEQKIMPGDVVKIAFQGMKPSPVKGRGPYKMWDVLLPKGEKSTKEAPAKEETKPAPRNEEIFAEGETAEAEGKAPWEN